MYASLQTVNYNLHYILSLNKIKPHFISNINMSSYVIKPDKLYLKVS